MHETVKKVTERIQLRSAVTRRAYLDRIDSSQPGGRRRQLMACSNLAHGTAACSAADKTRLQAEGILNIGIVSAYNDMLSAPADATELPTSGALYQLRCAWCPATLTPGAKMV